MRYRWLRGLSVALLTMSSAGCASCAAPPGSNGAGGGPDAGAPAPVEASAGAGAGDAGAGDAGAGDVGVDERLVRLDAAVQEAFGFAKSRVDEAMADLEARYPGEFLERYPTSTYTSGQIFGKWKADPADDWRSGFFPGVLWQMYRATGDVTYLERAKDWSEGIAVLKDNPIDYDIGCRFLNSFGTGYRMSNDANDPGGAFRDHATAVLLDAAATLNTRFNMGGVPVGALRALDDYMAPYPVYIDGMMNLELLFEGWNISGRPASGPPRVWYEHAVQSAITKMQRNVRADGGTTGPTATAATCARGRTAVRAASASGRRSHARTPTTATSRARATPRRVNALRRRPRTTVPIATTETRARRMTAARRAPAAPPRRPVRPTPATRRAERAGRAATR